MAAATFTLNVQGYWRNISKSGIPSHSGVYFVYAATYNLGVGTVTLNRLLYIGESDNVNTRIQTHEKYDSWRMYLEAGEELCFSTTRVDGDDRFRVEASYIFKHKPPVNTEYVNNFPFDQTSIISIDRTALLNTNFTVYKM